MKNCDVTRLIDDGYDKQDVPVGKGIFIIWKKAR